MASDEMRMAGEYEVIHSICIGDKDVIVGESATVPAEERYLCAYCEDIDMFKIYTEAVSSDDYCEIMQEFGERVASQAEKIRMDLNMQKNQGIQLIPLTARDCTPISTEDDLEKKVIVIRPEVLRREYRVATRQIGLCVGGFGALPHNHGSACFCVELYSGKVFRFKRADVLGTLEVNQLPEWAKHGLAEQQRREKTQKERER